MSEQDKIDAAFEAWYRDPLRRAKADIHSVRDSRDRAVWYEAFAAGRAQGQSEGRQGQRRADLEAVETVKTDDSKSLGVHHERYKAGYGTGYLDACDLIAARISGGEQKEKSNEET